MKIYWYEPGVCRIVGSNGLDLLRRRDILNKFSKLCNILRCILILFLLNLLNLNLLKCCSRLLVAPEEFKSGVAKSQSYFRKGTPSVRHATLFLVG